MPKNYFCSYCGYPLTITRKALKNKQTIVELIPLHECDEAYVDNITDSTSSVDAELTKPKEKVPIEAPPKFPTLSDKRADVKSTAPAGILSQVENAKE